MLVQRDSGLSELGIRRRTNKTARDSALASIILHLNAGNHVASIQTTCHAGTHRSVATAEILASRLRARGVGVVIRHAHRQKRAGDPY